MEHRLLVRAVLVVISALGAGFAAVSAQQIDATTFNALKFRYLGPPGNKVLAVAGVPGNVNIIYAGTPSGGVFKSVDGGLNWKPIFDNDRGISSIGAIAVARSAPNDIWVGTGEGEIRRNVAIGDGVYKSTDGGATWKHVGLDASGHTARIAVDPQDANRVFVAVIGRGYAPQRERGVFRTRDGGRTWKRVLFVDRDTGAADVVINTDNPKIIFASTWKVSMGPAGDEAGGPGSGIYRSEDGGDTWKHLSNGLPGGPLGRIGLGTSAKNPQMVYATISMPKQGIGSLWVSEDGGDSWTIRSKIHALTDRAVYFSHMGVFPDDPKEVYFLSQSLYLTKDGGATIKTDGRVFPDNHDIWIDPMNPDRIIVANDRYVVISENRGLSWREVDLPNAQIYGVRVDHAVPYNVYGMRRDGTGYKGPSNNLVGSDDERPNMIIPYPITAADWTAIDTAEVGVAQPDPHDDNLVWLLTPWGFDLLNQRTEQRRELSPWLDKARFRVSGFAFVASTHIPEKIYVGSQHVHESDDMGYSWRIISPDLTANDLRPPTGPWSDEATRSALEVIAESPVVPGMLWTGSNDGMVYVKKDGGGRWKDVTGGLRRLGVGPDGVVTSIAPSHTRTGTTYLTIDRHNMDDRRPYVFRTDDYGATWKRITAGIPESAVSYARMVKEDPRRPGLLYLGTEGGLYLSPDDGNHWTPLDAGLPRVPISGIAIQEPFNDVAVSTFGRGMWTLDDITPIQEFTLSVAARRAYLFGIRPTYIFDLRDIPTAAGELNSDLMPPSNAGEDPPQGAAITYYLKSSVTAPVHIEIRDAQGAVVRTLNVNAYAGIHRVWWLFDRDGDKGKPVWRRKLITPGLYDVRLSVGGVEQDTPLTLLQDPRGPTRKPLPND